MKRISRLGLALCAVLVVATVASCKSNNNGGNNNGGNNNGPKLTDPMEIITRSATSAEKVTSVHIEMALDGQFDTTALGASGGGLGKISLANTTATGDFDMTTQAFKMSLKAPSFLGLTADIIQVDGYMYTKTSMGGDKWSKSKATNPISSAAPEASLDIADQISKLKESLDQMGATATLKGTEKVAGTDAYHVSIDIPVSKINDAIAAQAGSSNFKLDSLAMDYWVNVGDLHPAKIRVQAASAQLGSVDLTVTLSNYNKKVTIQAPPADQIVEE